MLLINSYNKNKLKMWKNDHETTIKGTLGNRMILYFVYLVYRIMKYYYLLSMVQLILNISKIIFTLFSYGI